MAEPDSDAAGSKAAKRPKINIPSRTYGFPPEAFDWSRLPDFDTDFLPAEHVEAFIQALSAPDPIPQTPDDATAYSSFRLNSPGLQRSASADFDAPRRARASSLSLHDEDRAGARDTAAAAAAAADVAAPGPARPPTLTMGSRRPSNSSMFISARNDWAPVHEKVLRDKEPKKKRKKQQQQLKKKARSTDETREGYLYSLLKWPFLLIISAWIFGLGLAYMATRTYVYLYEQFVAWRGQREKLRRAMRATGRYGDWVAAARKMDDFFGNDRWKEVDEFAYYDSKTVKRVLAEMRKCRRRAEKGEGGATDEGRQATEDLKVLIEACVKNKFVGVENPRLYSQTYYGTKNLVQNFVDEGEFLIVPEREGG
jgi:hypothetical protein